MIEVKKWCLWLIVVVAFTYCAIVLIFLTFDIEFKPKRHFQVEVYEISNGFGYLIKQNDKILIKQDFVPAISKKTTFCTANDAKKVAYFVSEKIEKRESPTITINDLKQLSIDFTCLAL